ncbi:DUF3421 domain-containing protein [Trichonephila inaurata madagascariensis]|uniref:DUF3421 domain-containing protein n=1 Tax=Trichonephila inaurata madagascariensis TaxID=2747483 RepID=A0A8X6X5E5_9ARAC|nr:DUF3421 domain-containing protein [Trichonephila inaurata madagascariensis]
MTSSSPTPGNVVYFGGRLHGDQAYIGRVYDDDCYLVGTALPSKGKCIYLNKKREIKSTDAYDILTSDRDDNLGFLPMGLDSNLLFVAGGDEDGCLYCSRVVDGENTYYGWADKAIRTVNIPRESNVGPNKLRENYDILIHKLLDRLCICPMPPQPPPF